MVRPKYLLPTSHTVALRSANLMTSSVFLPTRTWYCCQTFEHHLQFCLLFFLWFLILVFNKLTYNCILVYYVPLNLVTIGKHNMSQPITLVLGSYTNSTQDPSPAVISFWGFTYYNCHPYFNNIH